MSAERTRPSDDPGIPAGTGREFSDVDASADPTRLVSYLDHVAGQVRDLKRRGYRHLDLKPGDAVLDVGCGPGTDVFGLEEVVGPAGCAVGVDVSTTMVEQARSRAAASGSRAEFQVAPAESLPFPDATFDAARIERVLIHASDPALAVREMARVTKPGGRILAIEPDHQMSAIDATDGELCDRAFRGLSALMRNSRAGRQLKGLFLAAGLSSVDFRVVPYVVTTWREFKAMHCDFAEELGRIGVERGLVTPDEARALIADLESRDAEGRFHACLMIMRCKALRAG